MLSEGQTHCAQLLVDCLRKCECKYLLLMTQGSKNFPTNRGIKWRAWHTTATRSECSEATCSNGWPKWKGFRVCWQDFIWKEKGKYPSSSLSSGRNIEYSRSKLEFTKLYFFWLAGQEAAHGKDEESKNQRQLKRTQVSGAGCFKQGCKYWIVKFVLVSGTSSWMYWLVVTCRGFLQVLFLLSARYRATRKWKKLMSWKWQCSICANWSGWRKSNAVRKNPFLNKNKK